MYRQVQIGLRISVLDYVLDEGHVKDDNCKKGRDNKTPST